MRTPKECIEIVLKNNLYDYNSYMCLSLGKLINRTLTVQEVYDTQGAIIAKLDGYMSLNTYLASKSRLNYLAYVIFKANLARSKRKFWIKEFGIDKELLP